ncbi:MAG: Rrf2 family transcriptional regulator [Clostridiales Family XIII bacterium]|jgi:Rrf2 family cysteine metabolism transcriptional repressor|nr:Rrf2 family transcriptional regulator [Clostridiales Family XIII bacterium]
MKISAKSKYALSSMLYLAEMQHIKEKINLSVLARNLSISKIYLEQVFAALKKEGYVVSVKGAGGGYALAKTPTKINVYNILNLFETSLFESTKSFLDDENANIQETIKENIFDPLDKSIKDFLLKITIEDLLESLKEKRNDETPMYYL